MCLVKINIHPHIVENKVAETTYVISRLPNPSNLTSTQP